MPRSSELIHFSDVSTRRGTAEVLHHLTFRIRAPECVAILGPNGSGKSTLIKLLTRELYPTSGTLTILGREDWDVFELRSGLGIVSNDLQSTFTRDMTGFEAVLSGFFSSVGLWRNNRITSSMEKKTNQALKNLEISHLGDRRMDEISSGEARRLLIARALVHDPKALIFDEPTNSLDLRAQHELRQTFRHLARAGIGIIVATHHLSDIFPEISRVIGLRGGRIQVDGSKKEVLTPLILKKIFNVPLTVIQKDNLYHAF